MSCEERSDDVLLVAYRSGDDAAATLLFNRYYARLLEFVRQQLGWSVRAGDESQDLAQSVFESVFLKCRDQHVRVEPGQTLWPLLASITLNKARNRYKYYHRQKRDRNRQFTLHNRDLLATGVSPEDAAILSELVEELLQAFESERRRRIVRLLLDGASVSEIASAVGTSERTVYKTREAAMRMLDRGRQTRRPVTLSGGSFSCTTP